MRALRLVGRPSLSFTAVTPWLARKISPGFLVAADVCRTLKRAGAGYVFFVKPIAVVCFLFLLGGAGSSVYGQARAASEFQITKISKNLITAPQYSYTGAQQYQANQRDRWLEVEVEFAAAPEFTEELTLKYFILVNGKLLTGEVTHVSIPAGRENRSVMYVSPRALARVMGNRALTPNAVQNIAVQIVQQGTVKSELSQDRAQPGWFTSMSAVAGSVLNKNETPFAPLYWDRYEQIKSPSR